MSLTSWLGLAWAWHRAPCGAKSSPQTESTFLSHHFFPQIWNQHVILFLLHRLSHETAPLSLRLSLNHQFFSRERRRRGYGWPRCAWHHPAHGGGEGSRWGGAAGEPTLGVSLFEKGAHKQTLHGWLTVCPWQLVICHRWAAFSGGNVINFTLPSSEISPINHPRLSLRAGLCCRPTWQIFTWFLCPQAPRGYRRRERTSNRQRGRDTFTWWQARRIIRKWDRWLAHVINKY